LALIAIVAAVFGASGVRSSASHFAAADCAPLPTIPVGDHPTGIAFDPVKGNLYVANTGDDTVSKINACSGVVRTISLHTGVTAACSNMQPTQVAYTSNSGHGHIWVSNHGDGGPGSPCQASVSELDAVPLTPTVLTTVPAGDGPLGMAVDPSLGLWVADNSGSGTSEINTNTAASASPQPLVSLSGSPYGATYDSRHKALWFSDNGGSDAIEMSAANPYEILGTPEVGKHPTGMVYALQHPWVANSGDGTVSEILGSKGSVSLNTVSVGSDPTGLGYGLKCGGIWVANHGSNTVNQIVLNLQNRLQVVRTVNVGSGPSGVAVGARRVWVTNSNDGTVSDFACPRKTPRVTTSIKVKASNEQLHVTIRYAVNTDDAFAVEIAVPIPTGGTYAGNATGLPPLPPADGSCAAPGNAPANPTVTTTGMLLFCIGNVPAGSSGSIAFDYNTPPFNPSGPAGLRKSTYLGICETIFYEDINGSGLYEKPLYSCVLAGASG
jgi:YVTN family beta-propeller protein